MIQSNKMEFVSNNSTGSPRNLVHNQIKDTYLISYRLIRMYKHYIKTIKMKTAHKRKTTSSPAATVLNAPDSAYLFIMSVIKHCVSGANIRDPLYKMVEPPPKMSLTTCIVNYY